MAEYIFHLRQLVGGDELLRAPSVSMVLRDVAGRVVVARHRDGVGWVLPGGTIEPGETPADAAVREMWEELRFCNGRLCSLHEADGFSPQPDRICTTILGRQIGSSSIG